MKLFSRCLPTAAVLAATVLCASVCAQEEAGQAPAALPVLAEVAPEVVATVNGRPLTREQLAAMAVGRYGPEALESLIAQEAICQAAARRGVTATPQEIDGLTDLRVGQELDRQAQTLHFKDLDDLLAHSKDLTATHVAELREREKKLLRPFVLPDLLARKLMSSEIEIAEPQLRAAYEEQYGAKAHAAQIVLQTKEEAEQTLAKLNGGADFSVLAREISIDRVTARNGGELPPLSRGSTLGDAAFALKPGQVSPVVKTDDGYHLVKLAEIAPASETPYEQVKAALHDALLEKAMRDRRDEWLNKLIAGSDVKRMF